MDTVNKNLGELDIRTANLFEMRLAHIKELAYELAKRIAAVPHDSNWAWNLKGLYQKARCDISWDGIENNRYALKVFGEATENLELAKLARYIKEYGDYDEAWLPTFFAGVDTPLPEARGKIACMKNIYTDTAYIRFGAFVQDPSVLYLDSFTAICEEVAYGRCEYCILPIENSDDGKLFGFYKLLSQYELNIVLTTRVATSEDSSSTYFALVRKGIENISLKHKAGTKRYFEFCLLSDIRNNIGDICAAAELFGITLHKIDSAPRTYSENEFEYHIVFDISSGDLYSFLIYLSLKTDHYSVLGLYSKIN